MSIGKESGEKLANLKDRGEFSKEAIGKFLKEWENFNQEEALEAMRQEALSKCPARAVYGPVRWKLKGTGEDKFIPNGYPSLSVVEGQLVKGTMNGKEAMMYAQEGGNIMEVKYAPYTLTRYEEDVLKSSIKKFEDYVDEYRKSKIQPMDIPSPRVVGLKIGPDGKGEVFHVDTHKGIAEGMMDVVRKHMNSITNEEPKKEKEMENITEKQARAVYGDAAINGDNRQVVSKGLHTGTFQGVEITQNLEGKGIRPNGANGHGSIPSTDMTIRVSAPTGTQETTNITHLVSSDPYYKNLYDEGVKDGEEFAELFYDTPDEILLDRYFVFTPRGVAKGRVIGTMISHELGCVQYLVETKLPKGVRLHDGGKWIVEDYYYCWDELYATIEDAIDSI